MSENEGNKPIEIPRETQLFTGYPDVMNVKQVMSALHICRSGVYVLLKSGALNYITIGRVYKITKASLINYVSGRNGVI
jgi:hypothetical protein